MSQAKFLLQICPNNYPAWSVITHREIRENFGTWADQIAAGKLDVISLPSAPKDVGKNQEATEIWKLHLKEAKDKLFKKENQKELIIGKVLSLISEESENVLKCEPIPAAIKGLAETNTTDSSHAQETYESALDRVIKTNDVIGLFQLIKQTHQLAPGLAEDQQMAALTSFDLKQGENESLPSYLAVATEKVRILKEVGANMPAKQLIYVLLKGLHVHDYGSQVAIWRATGSFKTFEEAKAGVYEWYKQQVAAGTMHEVKMKDSEIANKAVIKDGKKSHALSCFWCNSKHHIEAKCEDYLEWRRRYRKEQVEAKFTMDEPTEDEDWF